MSELIVIGYDDAPTARKAYAEVLSLQQDFVVQLRGLAIVEVDSDGKTHVDTPQRHPDEKGHRVAKPAVATGRSSESHAFLLPGWDSVHEEDDVAEMADWNAKIVEEFRSNDGRVGGPFEGAPLTLVHHRGRKSGRDYTNPMMYMAAEGSSDTIYVFASKAGAPTHPDWYYNLVGAGVAEVEVGTETYQVTVNEVVGEERDRIYAEQARRYPGFAEYEAKTAGIRTIPVLALQRR